MQTVLQRLTVILLVIIVAVGGYQQSFAQQGTPHPDDGFWDYRFGQPFLLGALNNGMAAANGKFYLSAGGGLVFKNGGQPYAMAVYDGTGWTYEGPVSGGVGADLVLPSVNGFLIAGNFTNLNNQKINYLATWDGSKWDSLGPQLNGRVRALYPGVEGLYVGGEFTKFGDSVANRIAVWDGSKWKKIIDAGTANGVNSIVYAITGSASALYVGGSFMTAGGVTGVNRIASWNWTSRQWTKLGKGFDNDVFSLAMNSGVVTAGGWFMHAGDGTDTTQYVSEFNGTKWVDIGDPLKSYPSWKTMYTPNTGGVYVSGDFTLGGQNYGVVYRSGSTWVGLGDANRGNNFGIAGDGSTIYACAGLSNDGSKDYRGIAKWDGTSWSGMGNPIGIYFEFPSANYVGTLGYANGIVYAGGAFASAGDIRRTAGVNLVMFQGGKWKDVGGPIKFNTSAGNVGGMATIGTDLYVAGIFTDIGGTPLKNIGRWDGTAWQGVGGGLNGTVNELAVYGGNLVAVGSFDSAGGQWVGRIAKWNGSTWSKLGGGIGVTGDVRTMAVSGNDLIIAGQFSSVDSGRVQTSDFAKWNGSTWSSIPSPPPISGTSRLATEAIAIIGNTLYAGVNCYNGNYIAFVYKWDGSVWTQVGGQFEKTVVGLWANGTELYAAGNFKTIGTDTIWNVAKWNGSTWTSLGSGVTSGYNGGDNAHVLLGTPEGLYVGGTFSQAGKYSSNNIALWKNYTPQSPVQSLNAPLQVSPVNRSTGQATNSTLSWNSVSSATSYHVQVSTDSTFATVSVNDSSLSGITRPLSGLAINTKYFWRVRAKNAQLVSWWSGPWNFKTGASATGVEETLELPKEFALNQNYPNPFNPSTVIRFDVPTIAHVRLTVYDALGRVVAVLLNEQKHPGQYQVEWQASHQSSGVYFCRMVAGHFVQTRKLLLLR